MIGMFYRMVILLAVMAAAATAGGRAVAEQKVLGTYKDWWAFVDGEGANRICYIGSVPKKAEGKYSRRGETYVLVTHRPDDKIYGEVSVEAGYPYLSGSEVQISIDGDGHRLFTRNRSGGDGNAWAYDSASDRSIVDKMKAGHKLIVKGTSSRGTLTTDTYSLLGFTAAFDAISRACPKE